jgi:hypothetical protein
VIDFQISKKSGTKTEIGESGAEGEIRKWDINWTKRIIRDMGRYAKIIEHQGGMEGIGYMIRGDRCLMIESGERKKDKDMGIGTDGQDENMVGEGRFESLQAFALMHPQSAQALPFVSVPEGCICSMTMVLISRTKEWEYGLDVLRPISQSQKRFSLHDPVFYSRLTFRGKYIVEASIPTPLTSGLQLYTTNISPLSMPTPIPSP